MSLKRMVARISLGLLMLTAPAVMAAPLIDGAGAIDGWGLTPFDNTVAGIWDNGRPPLADGSLGNDDGQTDSYLNSGIVWSEGNNASPIQSFPPSNSTPFYVPSPASNSAAGEGFDLEFLAWRIEGNSLKVLSVTSVDPSNGALYNGRTFHLGDVFMDVDGDGAYDYALAGGQWSTNLGPSFSHNMDAGLYLVDDAHTHGVTSNGGYGAYPVITDLVDPFAIDDGSTEIAAVGDAGFDFRVGSFDYGTVFGANEDGTWALEWTIDLSLLGVDAETLAFNILLHQTLECGNDYIERGPTDEEPVIPEPATLALLGLGLASMGVMRRRFRRS